MSSTPADDAGASRRAREPEEVPLYRFLGPRYWAVWIGIGIIRLVNLLPLRAQLAIGRATGRLAYVFARRDRRIANINIRMCLPQLDRRAQRKLLRIPRGGPNS